MSYANDIKLITNKKPALRCGPLIIMKNCINKQQLEELKTMDTNGDWELIEVDTTSVYNYVTFTFKARHRHIIYDLFEKIGVEIDEDCMLHGSAAETNAHYPASYVRGDYDVFNGPPTQWHVEFVYRLLYFNYTGMRATSSKLSAKFICPHCGDPTAKLLHCAVVSCKHEVPDNWILDMDESVNSYVDFCDTAAAALMYIKRPIIDYVECEEVATDNPHRFECSHCGAEWPDIRALNMAGAFHATSFCNIVQDENNN